MNYAVTFGIWRWEIELRWCCKKKEEWLYDYEHALIEHWTLNIENTNDYYSFEIIEIHPNSKPCLSQPFLSNRSLDQTNKLSTLLHQCLQKPLKPSTRILIFQVIEYRADFGINSWRRYIEECKNEATCLLMDVVQGIWDEVGDMNWENCEMMNEWMDGWSSNQ